MDAVALEHLCFAYPKGFRLGPLDLAVEPGARVALVGPSGAGKTTLLRLIAGLERPHAGHVRLGGEVASSPDRMLPPERRALGVVFQSGALWPHMTALRHLTFAAPAAGERAARALLARVGLSGKEDRRPGSLSGGEAQRLALARALIGEPRVLLLDEPLRSLDVHLRDDLALLVREVAAERGLTVLVVTHDREEALALAEDVVVLRAGRVVERGPALDLLRAPRTAWAAAFFARAACLPATPTGAGRVRTPFGELEAPAAAGSSVVLALLPGDVTVERATDGLPRARVLHSEPVPSGYVVTAVLDGRAVRAPADRAWPAGAEVGLRLCGPPRLLPETGEGTG